MTFKEMKVLDTGLAHLERRMSAIKGLIYSYYTLSPEDLFLLTDTHPVGFPDREHLCVSKIEASFRDELLRIVGPDAWHPLLKAPELYSVAHEHLWRGFPVCGRGCSCQRVGV